MNKKRYALWTSTVVAASLLLSGCQLLTGYQKIDEAENAKAWAGKIQPIADEVNIACIGTYHCEIARIDKTLIIGADTHEPINPAMLVALKGANGKDRLGNKHVQTSMHTNMTMSPLAHRNEIKIVPLSASGMPGLTNYYARVKPAKREIQVNFYPQNNMGYVERFAMIHDFVDADTYQLRAYQKKSHDKSGSLLETASPEPLCVELLQGSKVQRRFCKQLDTDHQGEFVEISMVQAVSSAPKAKKIAA
ncbi:MULTISPECIES: hypothetical protein [unclassified Psychrobacter]|uniref:hypothetical protein n=1 Tax=unclassified Psychrobacter TaxID=196806 RepID=UPI0025B471FE|nr:MULTISPECIES: hypothetical protein [unclassified Psychrobacter]MDN3452487.1 hypothetical protein [Psychrobacter sp. APC 3350]MDN3502189.1 hypothetical protein [Psychrobacter sp. 5A.1]